MLNEPLEIFFEELKKHIDLTVENLKNINVGELRLVKIERVVWMSKEGFYGKQPRRIPLNRKLEYIQGVNMIVFIDKKWTYVVFNGAYGYRFKLKDLDPVRMEYLKSWGEPRTLSAAETEFLAQELMFQNATRTTNNDEQENEKPSSQKPSAPSDPKPSPAKSVENDIPSTSKNVSASNKKSEKTIYSPEKIGEEFPVPDFS